jgi:hypothetical protein
VVSANWALVIATIVLAVITFFYMRHTKRQADETKIMADVMVRDFEFKVSPLIDIQTGTRSHSSRGFEIEVRVFNRGFCVVRTDQIVMSWCYKEAQVPCSQIKKKIDELLDKDNSITETFQLADDDIKTPAVPESENLEGYHLGRIVKASIWLEFFDVAGRIQKTRPMTLDPLMS